MSRKASRMASHMFMVQAFRVPGRSRVTVTTCPDRSTFTCSSVIISSSLCP